MSAVFLQRGQDGQLIEAVLADEIDHDHLRLWDDTWVLTMKAHRAGRPPGEGPEDAHWDWRRKADTWRKLLGYHSFALICEGDLQAMMLVRDFDSAKLPDQFGKPLVYVEFLATAPWNRPEFQRPPRFKGCGRILMLAAIEVSRATGAKGRVGLHSLPAAEPFYAEKCGMVALGRDAAHYGLTYFEMTEARAEAFRRNLTVR